MIPTDTLRPNFTIKDLVYISGGKKFAVLINESDLESAIIYDQRSKQILTRIGGEVDDCVRMAYSVESNTIVLIKSSTK